jgi:metallo-beta-lactamase family protein
MATTATEVFRKNAQVFDEETREYIMKGDNPLDFKNLKFTRSADESKYLNQDTKPKVIISASGMCEAGRIRHHLKHNLWDGKNSVIFVGYQAQGTLGRRILEGAKEVTLFGDQIRVNAEIYNLEGFSGHADRDGLLAWLSAFQQEPKKIFLVHGEPESKESFANYIKEKLGYDVIPVQGDSEYELDTNEFTTLEQTWKDIVDHDTMNDIRKRVNEVHDTLNGIFADPNLIVGKEMEARRIIEMNNLLLSLEKDAVNLRSLVGENHDNNIEVPEGSGAQTEGK